MKIYTKKGDKGYTTLLGGTKVSKSWIRLHTYGTVDELNSHIGLCRALIDDNHSKDVLLKIQNQLFVIGSLLACDPSKFKKIEIPPLSQKDIDYLETEIDTMTKELGELRNFILPAGNETIAQVHIARSVCRRVERSCVHLAENESLNEPNILIYLNRLSDYLFVLARFISKLMNEDEIPWKK